MCFTLGACQPVYKKENEKITIEKQCKNVKHRRSTTNENVTCVKSIIHET
jgi:hypothetical protein